MIKFTPEQIKDFPVAHLSFSAIRCYMTDRQLFYKKHIRLEFSDASTPSMVEGKAYHKALETLWGKIKYSNQLELSEQDWNEVVAVGLNHVLTEGESGKVNFGKTGSVSKSAKVVEQALKFYRDELPFYAPGGIECKIKTECFDFNGEILPIELKIVYDLTSEMGDDIKIIDHKLVTTYTEQDDINAAYELQAAASFFTYWAKFGKQPTSMIFDQLKKSKNADKSPQLKKYEIKFKLQDGSYHPCLYRFLEIYKRVVSELAGLPLRDEDGNMKFIPNPFDMLNGEESWEDFCEEVEKGAYQVMPVLDKLKEQAEEIDALLSGDV